MVLRDASFSGDGARTAGFAGVATRLGNVEAFPGVGDRFGAVAFTDGAGLDIVRSLVEGAARVLLDDGFPGVFGVFGVRGDDEPTDEFVRDLEGVVLDGGSTFRVCPLEEG